MQIKLSFTWLAKLVNNNIKATLIQRSVHLIENDIVDFVTIILNPSLMMQV